MTLTWFKNTFLVSITTSSFLFCCVRNHMIETEELQKKKSNNIRCPEEHATCPIIASHEEESVTVSVECPFFSSLRNTSFIFPIILQPPLPTLTKLTHITINTKVKNKGISWNMTTVEAANESMATVADKAPVTAQRKVPEDLDTKLRKPCHPLSSYFAFLFELMILFMGILVLWCNPIKGSKGGIFNGVCFF